MEHGDVEHWTATLGAGYGDLVGNGIDSSHDFEGSDEAVAQLPVFGGAWEPIGGDVNPVSCMEYNWGSVAAISPPFGHLAGSQQGSSSLGPYLVDLAYRGVGQGHRAGRGVFREP